MKAKKRRAYLAMKQLWWERLPERVKASTTRPGSVKTR